MPKPYGFTSKGQIEFYLKQHYPAYFSIEELTAKFDIQSRTIKLHLREFQVNNLVEIDLLPITKVRGFFHCTSLRS